VLELATCGCWMYKERASQGGLVGFFDCFLWDMGESKAKRMTASMAKETVVQNMTLGIILHHETSKKMLIGVELELGSIRSL
jgi:hypothetical protein